MHDLTRMVERYYAARLDKFGATPAGVDWSSAASQEVRFEQLLRAIPRERTLTVLDYGCGYGAFAPYLIRSRPQARYIGYDLAPTMVEAARAQSAHANASFTSERAELEPVDVVVASGIFNVKLDAPIERWETYVAETMEDLASLARRGIAFNMLTAYSDPERMRPDLYYADPHRYFDWCRERIGRWVALLHDYGLYEFTLIAKRESEDKA